MSTPDPDGTSRSADLRGTLARTIRDGAVADVPWWESTPKDGESGQVPPRLMSEAYGALLRRQGLDAAGQPDGPRYAVSGRLGQGSGGTVWAVHDQRLDRTVALKVLNRGGDLAGFLHEARIAASLEHPNVLPIHDLDLTDAGDPCFAMKSIDGVSLGEALRRRDEGEAQPLIGTFSDIVGIFIAVGQALAYAHHRDVIHQDVKPDNIMLGTFGEVLLVDWGCAVRGQAEGGKLYGTPLYMAPEQARREFADRRSDVYCLGASLFHALLGRPPTAPGADVADFWRRKRAGVIDPITDEERARVPPALLAIALKALGADPGQRYAGVDGMTADLRAWQAGLAVSAWREPLWRLLHRWYQQHRAQCWTAIVALLLVAGAGALLWREKQRERSDWRVVIEDDFRDPALAATRWRALTMENTWPVGPPTEVAIGSDGAAQVGDGRLEFGHAELVMNVALRQRLFGALRAEWDYTPQWNGLNLNCFIGDDRTTSYTFHAGGWGDPSYVALTRGADDTPLATARQDPPLTANRTYRFRVEREAGSLRLYIDGRLMISHEDPNDARAMMPQSIGFDTWSGCRVQVERLRISTRPLPERISPLDASALLSEVGEHATAMRQYQDLAVAYAGSPLGLEAEFRAAHAALAAGETAAGEAGLHRLALAHPLHPLAPYAWFWLHESARGRGDRDLVEAAREGLVGYPRHPVQRRVLFDVGSERQAQMRGITPAQVGDPTYHADAVPVIEAALTELRHWAGRYGQPADSSRLFMVAGHTLLALGRADLILAHWPAHHQLRAQALIETGRYEEVLAGYPHLEAARRLALRALGRHAELAAMAGDRGDPATLRLTGDLEDLRRRFPHHPETAAALIDAGRAAEVADDPAFGDARHDALIELGRAADLLALGERVFIDHRVYALFQLGRDEEALRAHATSFPAVHLAILAADRRGDVARVDALIETARRRLPDHRYTVDLMAYHLIPILVRLDRGDAAGARKLADAALADGRFSCGLRFWHVMAHALGVIDEAAFLRQPSVPDRTLHLPLAQALRAEFAGDRTAAIARWNEWSVLVQRDGTGRMLRLLAGWRAGR